MLECYRARWSGEGQGKKRNPVKVSGIVVRILENSISSPSLQAAGDEVMSAGTNGCDLEGQLLYSKIRSTQVWDAY